MIQSRKLYSYSVCSEPSRLILGILTIITYWALIGLYWFRRIRSLQTVRLPEPRCSEVCQSQVVGHCNLMLLWALLWALTCILCQLLYLVFLLYYIIFRCARLVRRYCNLWYIDIVCNRTIHFCSYDKATARKKQYRISQSKIFVLRKGS